MTDIPAGAHALLKLIRKSETKRPDPQSYGVIIGYQEGRLGKPLTEFTIDELLAAQKAWVKTGFTVKGKRIRGSAAGAYQILRATLLSLLPVVGIPGSSRFIPSVQDQLGFALLERRGYHDYIGGKITGVEFARRLAQEWASWPVLAPTQGAHKKLTRGQSYYDGDGVNGATITPTEVENALLIAKMTPATASQKPVAPKEPVPAPVTPPRPASRPMPAPAPSWWARFLAWVAHLFRRTA